MCLGWLIITNFTDEKEKHFSVFKRLVTAIVQQQRNNAVPPTTELIELADMKGVGLTYVF